MADDLKFDFDLEFRGAQFEASEGLQERADGLERSIEQLPRDLRELVLDHLQKVEEQLTQRHSRPYSPGQSRSRKRLRKRSGDLLKSIRESVNVTGTTIDELVGVIGSDLRYAAVQEEGATITKEDGYMTIPLDAALTSQGTKKKASARDWPNTFVKESRKGNLLIFQRRGNGIVPLYLLRKEVTIPPRLGMGQTFFDTRGRFIGPARKRVARRIMNG